MTRAVLVALLALLVAAPGGGGHAAPATVTLVTRGLTAASGGVAEAHAVPRFDLVGFRWRGAGSVEFSSRGADGRWRNWQTVDQDVPAWTGTSTGLRYRTRGGVARLRASYMWSPVEHRPLRTLSVAGAPPIVSRQAWGGDELLRRNQPRYAPAVRLVFVHHTATPNDYTPDQAAAIVRGIDVFHVRSRGWNDIGYNFLVDRFGRVYEGRYGGITRNVIGAHALGFNTGSVGIALIGNFQNVAPPAVQMRSLERLIAWRLDLAHVDPVSKLVFVSGGSERWRAGTKVTLRAVSGHRDTGLTTCPGNQLYRQLDTIARVAEQTGLPKLYAPVVRGRIGGPVVFSARLSSALPWSIAVAGSDGKTVARGSGVGPAVAWTWSSAGFAPGRYTWTMQAGPNVLPARGVVGGSPLPPPPVTSLIQKPTVAPAVISPNGDGYADTATISYTLTARAAVTATVTDASGAIVEMLFAGQEQSARSISFGWSPGDLPDGRYLLSLSAQADDGRTGSATARFTIDRTLSAVTATPAAVVPGASVSAGFALAGDAQVTVTVLAPDGSTLATLFQGVLGAGTYSYAWTVASPAGAPPPAGHYQVLVTAVDTLTTVTQSAGFDVSAAQP